MRKGNVCKYKKITKLSIFLEKLSYILNPGKPRKNKIVNSFMFGYDDR